MLPQRLRWLLPALIVFWMKVQLGATLAAHDERPRVPANTLNPSVATSTAILQDYNKRVHPPRTEQSKNGTQSAHKLVASPAGLLRPDKFQFYTYNDKGDMITRQMTVQEIQGLIAAGGADHVAMDKQEPHKADDVLTGGKKVMDVVQKVQNVLKSALDQPPTLTGSLPKIPEHANVEWSNILPSILSGETDAISSNSESNQLLYKLTTEKTESANSAVEYLSSIENLMNVATNVMFADSTKGPSTQDVQLNAYAGFTNNMQHGQKPSYNHYSQKIPITEKPMIPVPVITLTEQKFTTLQSDITESPVFQMLSVIPVETATGDHKEDRINLSAINVGSTTTSVATELPTRTEGFNHTEQFVKLTLSKAPENSTYSQLTSSGLNTRPVGITKPIGANLDNKVGQAIDLTTVSYATTEPSVSTTSSTLGLKQTTNTLDKVSALNSSYVLIQNTHGDLSGDTSFVTDIAKESDVNGTYDDKIISHTTTSQASLKPVQTFDEPAKAPSNISSATFARNETALHLTSVQATTSKIETSTASIPLTDPADKGSSIIVEESLGSTTTTDRNVNSQTTRIELLAPMEPLPTQLIDAFSSVMNQVSEAGPSVLSLSSTSNGAPGISIVNINYDERRNVSDADKTTFDNVDSKHNTLVSHDTNDENIERIAGSQTHETVTTSVPSADIATQTSDYSSTQQYIAMTMNGGSITKAAVDDIPTSSRITITPSTVSSMPTNNQVTANRLATTTQSTTPSPVWVQLDKVYNASLENQTDQPSTVQTLKTAATTVNAVSEERTTDKITSFEEIIPITSAMLDVTKAQTTVASIDKRQPSNESTTTDDLTNALMNLNLSNPVSTIDQILSIAPSPSSVPTIETISLPNDISNFVASNLTSGLIAGFPTSTTEEVNENKIDRNVSSTTAASSNVIKLAESVENVTNTYDKTTRLPVIHNDYRTEQNITYTQEPFLADAAENGTSELIALQTKKSNNTCSKVINGDSLSSESEKVTDVKSDCAAPNTILNERVDDSGEKVLPPSENKSANAVDKLKNDISEIAVTTKIQPLNVNETISHTDDSHDTKANGEKIEGTKVVSPDQSRLPVKVSLTNAANAADAKNEHVSLHTESPMKIETLPDKNDSIMSDSSTTQKAIATHGQDENLLGPAPAVSINNSNSEFFSSSERVSDATTDIEMPGIMLNGTTLSNENSTGLQFSENPGHANNAAVDKKDTDRPAVTISHDVTNNDTIVTPQTPVQNDKDDYDNNNPLPSSSSSTPTSNQQETKTDGSIMKVVTQDNTNVRHDNESSQSSFINGTDDSSSAHNASNQSEKNTPAQNTAHVVSNDNTSVDSSNAKNVSVQAGERSNSTETKPASSKHSEKPSKLELTRLQLPVLPSILPVRQTSKPAINQKLSEKSDVAKPDGNVTAEDKWTLISQQVPPLMTKLPKPVKPPRKPVGHIHASSPDEGGNVRVPGSETFQQELPRPQSVLPLDASQSVSGLDATVKRTSSDIVNFAKLCNELAFSFWVATNKGLSTARSLALSPFGMTSLLAMIFLGARGPTSDQMNEILGLDDVATFNPHLVFQNITDAVSLARGQGIANAAFVRELFADKMKVRKLMPFYKEQAQQFYEGLVAEVNFATISDLVRRRTNLLIRKQTGGRIKDFVKTNTVPLRSPLAALSANVFQTDCNNSLTSSIGRDGELYFAVSPAVRQRKLVPVPATTWRSGVLAGYEPSIDATVVALGGSDRLVSTIFMLPGQQGHTAPGDTLDRLEQRLVRGAFRDGTWNKLLKVLIPRNSLELQVPKFSHRSIVNATAALKRMGLGELFSGNADLKGINGVGHRLHLADVLQMNLFSTCGDENILSGRYHVETYPASSLRSIGRRLEESDVFRSNGAVASRYSDDVRSQEEEEEETSSLYTDRSYVDRFHRQKRQLSRTSERPRLKLDRPFLYFVRHNPSGIILHMGRFNPRLLP